MSLVYFAMTALLWICDHGHAQGVEPWAHQNPNGVPAPPQAPRGGVPVYGMPQPPMMPSPSSGNTDPNMAEMLQMLNGIMSKGGRSEFAGSGGSSSPASRGLVDSIKTQGSGGTGQGGAALTNIDGCTKEPGKFSFKLASKHPDPSCEAKVTMHEDMATFMNSNLNRCVTQAAQVTSVETGKIYHIGTMPSPEHLRRSPNSLHNYGLAIDVQSIVVNGKPYSYADKNPMTKAFFRRLRNCWADAAQKFRNGCLPARSSGEPRGSVGDEDHDHSGHLHLSLPMCPSVAGGANMAWWYAILIASAHASETVVDESKFLPPPSKITRQSLKVPGGTYDLTVKDTQGEPLAADHILTLELKCESGKGNKVLLDKLEACDFTEMRINKKTKAIEVFYKTSVMVDGRVSCLKRQMVKFSNTCE